MPTHPADYWDNYDTDGQYSRASNIVRIVYDNVDKLYSPKMGTLLDFQNAITLYDDEDLVKTRAILSWYKPTTLDSASKQQAVKDFNELLSSNGLGSEDYTGSELSDAEHFVITANMVKTPFFGPTITGLGAVDWELPIGSVFGWAQGTPIETTKSNVEQLKGPDAAGYLYGTERAYVEAEPWEWLWSSIGFR